MSSFSSSNSECQLSTHYSCQCSKCLGAFSNNQSVEDLEDLYQLQFTTTISNNTNTTINSSDVSVEEEGEGVERQISASSTSSSSAVETVEKVVEEEEKKEETQQPKQQKLSRRQKKHQHQKSFLDIAKSLRDSPRPFKNKPSFIETCYQPSWYGSQEKFIESIFLQKRNERKKFKRLRRRQYLPAWCYETNNTSLKSIREMVAVPVGGEISEDMDFNIYDRRAISCAMRLPRSTALAHIAKNRWIVRNRIFNCKKPFSHVSNWSDDASLNKHDTRGLVHFEKNSKFAGKDGRERYNRGHHRRSYRANHYHQGKQVYMGNSRKSIYGKPWLYNRQTKIYKGEDRLRESGWLN